MARKTVFLFLLICLLGGMLLFADRPAFLYPELPFPSVSKQTVVSQLREANGRFRKLATERSYVWYGIAAQRGAEKDKLIEEMGKAGWTFLQQEGSGYFFQQGTEKIVITSRMWSGDLCLVQSTRDGPSALSVKRVNLALFAKPS
ncbi:MULTISPECIES: hypothetical protein [Brevibacillus]|uniref:hypothetical protein n=1 Tax=Brevibacillus TaxID=55080 RepID=UPI002E22E853|nr:hypothetical protein [Brevibacillus borstelensis]